MNELGYPPDFEKQVSPWWKSKGFWSIAGTAQQDIQIWNAYEHGDLGPSESLARKLEPSYPTSRSSRVLIQGNRVLVPVRLGYRNQEILTLIVLDTGASSTTIYRPVASRLHLLATRRSSARAADGRTVASDIGILDYLVVGPHKLSNIDVLVIDFKGDEEISKGLLGMNFLKKVRYDIDFHNQTINWR